MVAAGHAEPGVVEPGPSSLLSWQLAWKPSYADHLLPLLTHCLKKAEGRGRKEQTVISLWLFPAPWEPWDFRFPLGKPS